MENNKILKEIVPKSGIIFNEKNEFPEILCKPKILPLKSMTIKKLEEMDKNFERINNENSKKK
jgi:BBSome-interacting protein 1